MTRIFLPPTSPEAGWSPTLKRLRRGVALGAALLALAATDATRAGVAVSPTIAYYFGDGPGEGLSVSSDGRTLLVSSPNAIEDGVFLSFVPEVKHLATKQHPFVQTHNLALGFGEVTDVAVVPSQSFGLAVVRGDAVAPDNALLAIRHHRVLQSVPIPEKPDGMKVTPDGQYAVVAVEKGGEIRIYDLSDGAGRIRLAALITQRALAAYYVGVDNPVENLEPEAVGMAPDSSFALVTIQDSSSVAAIDLNVVRRGQHRHWPPQLVGRLALKNVVHLPYGFEGADGALYGVSPDGAAISPDQSFAMLAHEADGEAKHLAGFSVLDLTGGLENITAQTYCLFDVDPTLLANTGLTAAPVVAPGDPYPTDADALPRLDPASFKIVERGGQTVAAMVVERYDASDAQEMAASSNESRGSVLFLDAAQALNGAFRVIERVPVGADGSRLEVVDSAEGGRWIFVSISNGGEDRGTVARLEVLE